MIPSTPSLSNSRAIALVNGRPHHVTILHEGAVSPGNYTCRDDKGNLLTIHYQQLKIMPSVPLKYRESSFTRFAHVIGAALVAHPQAIPVDPSPMTQRSYMQPLRDAIKGKSLYGWTSPHVDDALFARLAESLQVAEHPGQPGMLLVGPRAAIEHQRVRPGGTVGKSATTASPDTADVIVDVRSLEPLLLMLSNAHLAPAPQFVVCLNGTQAEQEAAVADYENRYDVSFVPHETSNGYWRLLPPLVGIGTTTPS